MTSVTAHKTAYPSYPRESTLVLGFVFLGLPLFDMINGYLIVRGFLPEGSLGSPSQAGRFLAMLMLLYATRESAFSLAWACFFAAFFAIETLAGLRLNDPSAVLYGYVTISRFVYLYLLFILVAEHARHEVRTIGRLLKYNLNFICLSILFGFATGLGNSTYGWGFGTKGFFASGNGLGIYLGVSAVILGALRRYRAYTEVGGLTYVLVTASLILLGTKTSFALAGVVVAMVVLQSRFRILIAPTGVLLILMFWNTLTELVSIYFDVVISRFSKAQSLQTFIFSGRVDYVINAFSTWYEQGIDLPRLLFGGGAFLSFQDPLQATSFDTLETDPFDLLFMYGLFGLGIYVCLTAAGGWLLVKYPLMLLGLALLIGHSVFAGHVLFNAMSSTLLAIMLAIGVSWRHRSTMRSESVPSPGKRL